MSKIADVRTKSDDELSQVIADLSKEAFNLRFQKTAGQLENVTRPRLVRKELARAKTALRERAMGVSYAAKAAKSGAAKKPAAKTAKKKAS